MARTVAEFPSGSRITDYVSLGVIAKTLRAVVVPRGFALFAGKNSVAARSVRHY
jgi:hypothetical protein